jgi:hypothetical protein
LLKPKEKTAVEVGAIVGGERAAQNERNLHEALRTRAAAVDPPSFANAGDLFDSFFIGGLECATHRRRDGRRLDLIAATSHDVNAARDYRMLAEHGLRTVRDGLRWHLIETAPGYFDWSSFLPMLRAARATGTQVIWDLAHWGWPDGLSIWTPAFIDRFAGFAKAAAQIVRDETEAVPFYVPVNEISFWAWAGGTTGFVSPLARNRGNELKAILVRAAIAAVEAVRSVDPRARIVHAEPAIHVVPRSTGRQDIDAARRYTGAQFEALDFLSGRRRPELGGRADYVDIVGVNYYLHNQWIYGGLPISVDCPQYRPFHELLADFYDRYRRPMFVAETGIEGDLRPAWLRMIGDEVSAARQAGVPVEGICLYPILDYPGWEDERSCPTGLFGWAEDDGTRPLHQGLANELRLQRRVKTRLRDGGA